MSYSSYPWRNKEMSYGERFKHSLAECIHWVGVGAITLLMVIVALFFIVLIGLFIWNTPDALECEKTAANKGFAEYKTYWAKGCLVRIDNVWVDTSDLVAVRDASGTMRYVPRHTAEIMTNESLARPAVKTKE